MTPAETTRDLCLRGGVADLRGRTLLRVTGADRARYLNGQVTANVAKLAPGRALAACVTSVKGKLCGDVFITAEANVLIVDAEPELRESLAARLEKYIVADDVTVAEAGTELALFHVIAPEAPALHRASIAASRRYGCDGWDAWLAREDAECAFAELTSRYALLDEAALDSLRIDAGIPRWGRELDEDSLPAEAGLDRTHVDFHKGCYIGQEVISRIESVGHVNRRLVVYAACDGTPLAPGTPIFSTADAERPAGITTTGAWSFALEKPAALGYHRRGTPTDGLAARPPGAAEIPVALHEFPLTK